MREEFPEWAEEVLPPKEGIPSFRDIFLGGAPETRNLRVTYRSFRECVMDLVRWLRAEVLRDSETSKS